MTLSKTKILLILGVLFTAVGCTQEPEFVFVIYHEEKAEIEVVDQVPLIVGLKYGWLYKVKNDKPIHWKEEFTLPSIPKVWGGKPAASNFHVQEKTDTPIKSDVFGDKYYGFVWSIWKVAEGDPPGEYRFSIHIDNSKKKEFFITFHERSI